jgi:hypothetical protein
LRFINPDQLFATARVLPETIIGDPIKPGGKARFATKAADVFVSAQKSFLSKIIGEREIGSGKLAQQTSHTRLMPTDQLAKSVLVIIDKDSRDEVRIS